MARYQPGFVKHHSRYHEESWPPFRGVSWASECPALTPNNSTCGYVVEWLRTAYKSTWHLNPEFPEVETPGRYVFAPEGTPVFPGPHNLWSRIWITDFWDNPCPLGESFTAKQTYSNGATPNPYPSAIHVGQLEAIANGENFEGLGCWSFTAENGASWERIGNGIAIDFEDSANCGGDNPDRQFGSATAKLVTNERRDMTVRLSGLVEQQNSGFDVGQFLLDGLTIATIEGQNDGLGCVMGNQSITVTVPLEPGTYDIEFTGDTIDGRYHVDCSLECELSFEPPFDEPDFENGFNSLCFLPLIPPPPPEFKNPEPDVWDRDSQQLFARMLLAAYDDQAAGEQLLRSYLGSGAVITSVPNSVSEIPGSQIAVTPELSVVVIPGTSNFEQLAFQVIYAGNGLTNFGDYSTNQLWKSAYDVINGRINAAGAPPTKPILLVGHSYGGAVAAILAARYSTFQPDRLVYLVTFGMPRPGDARLTGQLVNVQRAHLANTGDFVTGVPPIFSETEGLSWVLPDSLREQWSRSSRAGRQIVMDENGNQVHENASQFSFLMLTLLIPDIILALPAPPSLPHLIGEYIRRLEL